VGGPDGRNDRVGPGFGIHRSPTLLPWIGHTRTSLRRLAVVYRNLPALDIANSQANFVARLDDPVSQPLEVSLRVVVGDELLQSTLQ
jgi:hypothetical protein